MTHILNIYLDRLWQATQARAQEADVILKTASEEALLTLAAFEYVIETGVTSIKFTPLRDGSIELQYEGPIQGRATVSRANSSAARPWRTSREFGDFFLEANIDLGTTKTLDFSKLLQLIQEARDHSDSLLFLPAALRLERIQGLASQFGRDEQEIRNALAALPAALAALT